MDVNQKDEMTVCPECGARVNKTKFCSECGKLLDPEAKPRSAVSGEAFGMVNPFTGKPMSGSFDFAKEFANRMSHREDGKLYGGGENPIWTSVDRPQNQNTEQP